MNCQNFETVVNDLARNQMMEASVRQQAVLHGDECELCSARLRAEQRLTHSLKQLAEESRAANIEGAPVQVEERLLAEFRNHRAAIGVTAQRSHSNYWVYAAIAAVLLVVVGIGTARVFVSAPAAPQSLNAGKASQETANTAVAVIPASVTSGTEIVERNADSPSSSSSRKTIAAKPRQKNLNRVSPEALTASNLENEVATEFYPVGYSSTSSVQDGGQVVRVELPRSAMARFGVPVNMDRYDERVKADVLVGTDGIARAIRFVQ